MQFRRSVTHVAGQFCYPMSPTAQGVSTQKSPGRDETLAEREDYVASAHQPLPPSRSCNALIRGQRTLPVAAQHSSTSSPSTFSIR